MSERPDDWDGVCACGKAEMDGKSCALGATHKERPAEDPPSLEDMLA
jgi:hypothetical protein